MSELIKPRVVSLANRDGVEKEFTISRLPCTVGREVIAKYPTSNIPKVGDYKTSEETMLLLLRYVSVEIDGREQKLTTKALVDSHVDDVIQLIKLEYEMIEENTGFFGQGSRRGFLDSLLQKLMSSITPTLMPLLERLLAADSQRTPN